MLTISGIFMLGIWTSSNNVDALIDKATKFTTQVKNLVDSDLINKQTIRQYAESIVRERIYHNSDIKTILDNLQTIVNTPDIGDQKKSDMFLKVIEEIYEKKVDSVIGEIVAELKKYNDKLLASASSEFKSDYKAHIASVNADILKLAEMNKTTSLTESQKAKIQAIVGNKIDDSVMIILERISKNDESLQEHVFSFIISNIMDLIKENLTTLNQTTKIPNFAKLIDIIDRTPSVTQLGGVKEKNKNKSKKNKHSNKRKTKRRKSANSKKIKFTR